MSTEKPIVYHRTGGLTAAISLKLFNCWRACILKVSGTFNISYFQQKRRHKWQRVFSQRNVWWHGQSKEKSRDKHPWVETAAQTWLRFISSSEINPPSEEKLLPNQNIKTIQKNQSCFWLYKLQIHPHKHSVLKELQQQQIPPKKLKFFPSRLHHLSCSLHF